MADERDEQEDRLVHRAVADAAQMAMQEMQAAAELLRGYMGRVERLRLRLVEAKQLDRKDMPDRVSTALARYALQVEWGLGQCQAAAQGAAAARSVEEAREVARAAESQARLAQEHCRAAEELLRARFHPSAFPELHKR